MTDELDEILLDITPNLTSSHGDPDSYDAYDCIEYPSYQIAREKLTHRCLTCGLPECKPWYETKQAIQALIADQMAEYQAQLLKDYKEDIATAVREARIDERSQAQQYLHGLTITPESQHLFAVLSRNNYDRIKEIKRSKE